MESIDKGTPNDIIELEGMFSDSKVRPSHDRESQDWSAAIYNGQLFSHTLSYNALIQLL